MLLRCTSPVSCLRSSALGLARSLTPLRSGGVTRSSTLVAGPGCSHARFIGGLAQRVRLLGIDLNEGMLAVAARTEPKIEWRLGDAALLPFEDSSFDAVVSQFALMYFPDRVASRREMWRTLAPGGRLAIAVWASIDHARGYQILLDIAVRQCGRAAADVLAAPFVLGNQVELAKLFVDSGISGAEVRLYEGSIRFPSVKEFIRIEVKGSPLANMLSDDMMQTLAVESENALVEFVVPSGEIVMPMDAHIVTASKG